MSKANESVAGGGVKAAAAKWRKLYGEKREKWLAKMWQWPMT
jgi:hypothetical protein